MHSLDLTSSHFCSSLIPFYKTASPIDLIKFYHPCLYAPTKTTWLKDINTGYFNSWTGLTSANVRKYLIILPETHQGHMKQIQKNIQSTHKSTQRLHNPHRTRTSVIISPLNTDTYSDLTGAFPITSNRGNKYIFVFFHAPTNSILAEPLPNKAHSAILHAFTTIHQYLKQRGFNIDHHIFDNDSSKLLTDYFISNNITYQHVPPHMHHANAAEHAIQTFKSHFISGLSLLPLTFPMHLWCRLHPQCITTLILLRTSNINPKLSAHATLEGNYDIMRHPMAPPGAQVMVHLNADQRPTFSQRTIPGFYLSPELNHYRCFRIFIPSTGAERSSASIEFLQQEPHAPTIPSNDILLDAASSLTKTLQTPDPE